MNVNIEPSGTEGQYVLLIEGAPRRRYRTDRGPSRDLCTLLEHSVERSWTRFQELSTQQDDVLKEHFRALMVSSHLGLVSVHVLCAIWGIVDMHGPAVLFCIASTSLATWYFRVWGKPWEITWLTCVFM